jgi:hypothetical protein
VAPISRPLARSVVRDSGRPHCWLLTSQRISRLLRPLSLATTDTQVACSLTGVGVTVGADVAKPRDDVWAGAGCGRSGKGARVIVVDGAVRVDIVISKGLWTRLSLFPIVRVPLPRPQGARRCLSAGCWHHLPDQ